MKIRHHSKASIKLRPEFPLARQPCKRYEEVVKDRSHRRQNIPYRVVRRGC